MGNSYKNLIILNSLDFFTRLLQTSQPAILSVLSRFCLADASLKCHFSPAFASPSERSYGEATAKLQRSYGGATASLPRPRNMTDILTAAPSPSLCETNSSMLGDAMICVALWRTCKAEAWGKDIGRLCAVAATQDFCGNLLSWQSSKSRLSAKM